MRQLAVAVYPYCPSPRDYNTVGRLPYYAACLFSCAAGALDPLGLKLFLVSTVPAAFGGSSGLLWLDTLFPRGTLKRKLLINRHVAWWIAAAVFGLAYIFIIGPGIEFTH